MCGAAGSLGTSLVSWFPAGTLLLTVSSLAGYLKGHGICWLRGEDRWDRGARYLPGKGESKSVRCALGLEVGEGFVEEASHAEPGTAGWEGVQLAASASRRKRWTCGLLPEARLCWGQLGLHLQVSGGHHRFLSQGVVMWADGPYREVLTQHGNGGGALQPVLQRGCSQGLDATETPM